MVGICPFILWKFQFLSQLTLVWLHDLFALLMQQSVHVCYSAFVLINAAIASQRWLMEYWQSPTLHLPLPGLTTFTIKNSITYMLEWRLDIMRENMREDAFPKAPCCKVWWRALSFARVSTGACKKELITDCPHFARFHVPILPFVQTKDLVQQVILCLQPLLFRQASGLAFFGTLKLVFQLLATDICRPI